MSAPRQCAQCHSDVTDHFAGSTHSRLALTGADPKVGDTGCESCHGPGSLHVAAGGGAGTHRQSRASPPRPASSATLTSAAR